jgi:hypothetical protein
MPARPVSPVTRKSAVVGSGTGEDSGVMKVTRHHFGVRRWIWIDANSGPDGCWGGDLFRRNATDSRNRAGIARDQNWRWAANHRMDQPAPSIISMISLNTNAHSRRF